MNTTLTREIANMEALIQILTDPVKMAQWESYLQARREQRRAKHDAKWQALLDRMTDKAEAVVAQYKLDGYEINKLFTDRRTGNVAALMVRWNTWDSAKGRVGRKLAMVYPDGSRVQTMEKSISVKPNF